MKVNAPNMKGFNKFTAQEQISEEAIPVENVKQPFPIRQFILACLCVIAGSLLFWFLSSVATLHPNPLAQNDSGFELASLNHYMERNAPLRLPLIESETKINSAAIFSSNLAIRFEDGRQAILIENLPDTNYDSAYSIRALTTSSLEYEPVQIAFNNTQRQLDANQRTQLDALVTQLDSFSKNSTITIKVSAYKSADIQEVLPQQSMLEQVTSSIKLPLYNPFRMIASLPTVLTPLTNFSQRPWLHYQANVSEEPAKTEKKKTDDKQLEQKTAPQGIPLDYTEVSDTILQIQVGLVRDYLQSAIQTSEISAAVTQQASVSAIQNGNIEQGVIIEFSQLLPESLWQALTSNQQDLATDSQTTAKFQIINGDIINLITPNGSTMTLAILPSALKTYYGTDTDYIEASPHTYPSALSLLALSIGIGAALYMLAYRHETPDADIIKKQKLVDSFVSDAPASNLSQDKLGFSEISTSLSRFLRNAGTKAPLTLAITGAWGSGKSSLMYFLKENLLRFNMQPVWVNAWHHQSEEQFLAGLLSAIRRHAVPPFWSSPGLLYRWNLLKMRWSRSPFFHYSFAFIFIASITFIIAADPALLTSADSLSISSLPFFSALIAAIPILNAGMDKISRLSKASLVQTLFGSSKQSLDLRANVGLREKFASEFGMLCDALGDSTLTIFIDDLDRCKEERIMDVMETVNYLVCSGECFIVISMEKEPIEKAIEAYYKNSYSDLDSIKLKLKARRYLEKIINIEIPVPSASEEQFTALVKVKDIQVKPSKLVWVKQFALVASLFFSIGIGYFLASFVEFPETAVVVNNESSKSNIQNANMESAEKLNAPAPDNTNSESSPQKVDYLKTALVIAQNKSENKTAIIIIPLIFIVAIGMLIRAERYRQRKRIVETDSEPFLVAIAIWARVMGIAQKTPRSIKRFVNRTRFLAMRNAESQTNIKEENLVTLAALIDIAKDKGLSDLEAIEEHLPTISDPVLQEQITSLIKNCHSISVDKRTQLQSWIRGFNVS